MTTLLYIGNFSFAQPRLQVPRNCLGFLADRLDHAGGFASTTTTTTTSTTARMNKKNYLE